MSAQTVKTPDSANDLRLRKSNKLLTKAAYDRVFKKAQRSRDKLFTVLFRPNNTNDARLGLAISKKMCRRAVDRNRIKRVVRESFRCQTELGGLDIVVINRQQTVSCDNHALYQSLDGHWQSCRRMQNRLENG